LAPTLKIKILQKLRKIKKGIKYGIKIKSKKGLIYNKAKIKISKN